MKKLFLSLVIATSTIFLANAGGLVTNSNQSASYYRMLARGASISGDAVYYNPAGLAFLDQGLTISLNTQMIWMKRTLTSDLQTLKNKEFVGTLYVPVFPGVYAAYKTGNWAFSLGFNPPAGGGSIEFADGLPMLENDVSAIPAMLSGNGIPTTQYSMTSMMKGSSIVYGVQAGATYRINEMFSVFGGLRMSFASNGYEGYLKDVKVNPTVPPFLTGQMLGSSELLASSAQINATADALGPENPQYVPLKTLAGGLQAVGTNITDKSLDATQKGSGIAPIIGIHFNTGNLNLAAKYEFSTKITLTNDPKKDDLNMYPKAVELRSDVPALLSLAGSYDISPALRFSVTYLHHFEPQATIESWAPNATLPQGGTIIQRQDLIDKGTNEFMAGLEWKLGDKFLVSAGCQYTKFGVSDQWQNDITHHLSNFTMGLGAAYHINERMSLNIGGLYTWYDSSTIKFANPIPHNMTYDRANKAVAIGIDYRF